MNVLGRGAVARIVVVDIGVAEALPPELPSVHRKVALGTANLALGPGQTPAQTVRAIGVGFEVIDAEWARPKRGLSG